MYNLVPKARFSSSVGNGLFNSASLDLHFAKTKSLVDATTGSNLIDFTRASSGTYVGSDGLIRSAVTNLLLQSENFGTTWTTNGLLAFGSGSTLNAAAAPDGTTTADLLTENSSTSEHRVETPAVTWAANTTYTFSVFAKANGRARIDFFGIGGANFTGGREADFNLANGTVISTDGSIASISPLSNGWYRLRMTFTTSSAPSASSIFIRLNDNSSNFSYTGDGTSGIYLWGAQLEQSDTVGEYVKTTSTINSAPRFDHDPVTGESLGLLVEEQRSNLLAQSEQFTSPTWTATDATVTVNSVTAPSGASTANRYTEAASGTPGIFQGVSSITASTVYTGSLFIKRGNNDWYRLFFVDNSTFANGARAWFDTSTGAFGTVENIGTGTGAAVTVTRYANDWWRISLSTAIGGSNTSFRFQVNSASANGSATRVYNSVAYFWGAQLEAGAFPTSYIPTTTAAVTRAADVASISGSNFSSWYRQDEGTVFAETQLPAGAAVNTSSRTVFDITDGSNNNRLNIRAIGSTTTSDQLTVRSAGSTTAQFGSNGSAVSTATRRFAGAAKADDFAAFATGATSAATDTSGAMPVGNNQASIGSSVNAAEYLSGTIRRLVYWGQRLPNTTLQAITQ